MKRSQVISLLPLLLFLTSCGKPPKSGGPPQGDFPVNVVGAAVRQTNLQERVVLVGNFEAPERLRVSSAAQGELLAFEVEEGAWVDAGTVLARLDSAKVDARLSETRARLTLAETTASRLKALLAQEAVSQQELDDAEAQVAQLRAALALLEAEKKDTVLTAPFSGRAGERLVSVGQFLQAGQVLVELVQTDPLEIRFDVPERYISRLSPGQRVQVETDAVPQRMFEGTVSYLATESGSASRTLALKAVVANADGALRPGYFGRVSLVLQERPDALAVPEAAVMQQGTGTFVMARNAEGRAEMRPVVVGLRLGGWMEILEGLELGDAVVVEGLMKTRPGSKLAFSAESLRYGLEPTPPPES